MMKVKAPELGLIVAAARADDDRWAELPVWHFG